jgi:predicted DNA-binding transcriptional regulator YafY
VRTVYRDIEQLSAAGIPVYADRGPGGGFQLLDGFRTKLTGLTENEAETLFIAGLPGPATQLASPTSSCRRSSSSPRRCPRSRARRTEDRPALPSRSGRLVPQPAIGGVPAGHRQGGVGRELHRNPLSPPGHRDVTPAEAARTRAQGRHLFLVAESGGQMRTYRISNIVELTPTEERFARRKDFDLVRFWTASSRAYEVGLYRDKAVFRVSQRGRERLHWLGTTVADAARDIASPPDSKGWVTVEVPIESIEQAAIYFLQLGTEAEVLKPRELRRRLAASAGEMAKLNS